MRYLRNLLTVFPQALVSGRRELGLKGAWLACCVFAWRGMPFPLRVREGITLANWHEAVNYVDNFILGELRQPDVEKMLASESGEVVEVGVNVGITARWWLASGRAIRVVGVDMMGEALDYTRARLKEAGHEARGTFIAGGAGSQPGSMEVSFDDPLEGTNRLDATEGAKKRAVQVNTLDHWLRGAVLQHPLLLKLDIEGFAGEALKGARDILSRVRWVVIETHHPEELASCASQLAASAFQLRHFHGRTMWWSRD
jgi:FkbM family methyltransferase